MAVYIAGIDEVGRGPLAGPVVAAAVILDPDRPIEGLRDSKKLAPFRREVLAENIKQNALCYAFGSASVAEIDEFNILRASLLAMERAVLKLKITPTHALVDGLHCPKVSCTVEAIVRGDQTVPAISAASIIAKVARDAEMVEWDLKYPGYGLAKHKGYPTKEHIAALKKLGITPIHRLSFAPVASLK